MFLITHVSRDAGDYEADAGRAGLDGGSKKNEKEGVYGDNFHEAKETTKIAICVLNR
jgi:hypothetical protein